ncbi:acyl-CoA dehydrogenase family protein [Nocardia vinacea]|uniref:Acyl-CoA dehydrogenase family protein n=1 Tax=Nocardia vinacea TaxID=96468 RepID=A0ABZ1YXM9_9NOCA|nr:acyl-CoA dehydrogenase family protein [Nocardia vinacea]
MSNTDQFVPVAEFRLEARAWLAEQKPPEPTEDSERRFDDLRQWQRCLFDAGWLGLTWPVDCGGRGLTALHQATFNRELARARAPRPAGVVGIEVVGPTIVAFGSESQRRARLPNVLSGADIWCQGFSEPGAGSDLAALRTRAERVPGGWLLNGHKVWTTWSHKATGCAVLARTNARAKPHHGISYLLVPLDLPGITVRPLTQLNGDTEFGEVFFDDVLVPEDALVGEVDQGWSYATHTLSSERGSLVLRRAADLSVAFDDLVAELSAGGRIDDDQLVSIGDLATDLFALDAQCDRIVERMTSAPGVPSASDSLDKAMLTRFEQSLFGFARDCLGSWAHLPGRRPGGLDSTRWAHDYFYGRAASIYGGTAQVQRNIIGERLLGLPREPRG